MPWWKRPFDNHNNLILVGDYIINKNCFPKLKDYFKNGPMKVKRITKGTTYAGGYFIYGYINGKEQGFYLNAIKKVTKK